MGLAIIILVFVNFSEFIQNNKYMVIYHPEEVGYNELFFSTMLIATFGSMFMILGIPIAWFVLIKDDKTEDAEQLQDDWYS